MRPPGPGPPRLLLGLLAVLALAATAPAWAQDAADAVATLPTVSTPDTAASNGTVATPASLPRPKTNLTVGYLTAVKGELKDRQGLAVSGAITLALEEVNNDPTLLPNVNLVLRWNDTRGDQVLTTRAITEMICDGVAAFFGPEGTCQVESIVAQSRNIPMISYKCSDYAASTVNTFARTEPPDRQVTKSVISLLTYYLWKQFCIIAEEQWKTVANELERQAIQSNMLVNHKEIVMDRHECCVKHHDCCQSNFWSKVVNSTKDITRIYVFLGTPISLIEIMSAMKSHQLFDNGEYLVIYVDMMTFSESEAKKYLWKPDVYEKSTTCDNKGLETWGRSLLVVVASPPAGDYANFTTKVKEYNQNEPFNFKMPSLFTEFSYEKHVSIYAAYLYDSVKLYAYALNKLLEKQANTTANVTEDMILEIAKNGTKIIETIIDKQTYKSITGAEIKLDKLGDSEGNFSVLALKPRNLTYKDFSCQYQMVPIAIFRLKEGGANDSYPEYKLISKVMMVDWPNGHKPLDRPSCGFHNEFCQANEEHGAKIAAITLAVLLFCSSVVTLSIYRKWKIEQEIEGLLWKIDPQDLHGYYENEIVSSPSKLSLMSGASYESRCGAQVFAATGRFRGVRVRVKELKFSKKKDIPREIMKEMRLLRDIRHDNINSFIGACLEPMRVLIITDYCAKGSLYDIVENEDIKLDMMFVASLVHDLIKGMTHIHDSVLECHGNLKSSNCVVTSRWVLQITDFGLHELRNCAENDSIGEHQYYRNLLWKAPEFLRHPHFPIKGSQKGDVYAFAIILYEIIGRKGPFGLSFYEPKEIINRVKSSSEEEPFRPDLDLLRDSENGGAEHEYILTCIQDCWNENPELRPDFQTIRRSLKKMKAGIHRNIMDQMMEMMEKYANNLEDLVDDRTRLLDEEKRKTEDLLHRMLPSPVATRLTRGDGVEPETFEMVTIYFSDIVGFTAMSAESTPLQVVNFLNDLYTLFDRIIKGYEVYKVETIGDAYMVVSGLPLRNEDRHAGEIASMSLDLLEAVKNHHPAHRPNETLKLRIGVHTGPVVAGVVGLTMPRYCLFGDTVNTASRMESNGEPLKIHISSQCRDALEKIGGYVMEERGLVAMKGKGSVKTYWLVGATDSAIQPQQVDLEKLPSLFCRPRRSPKLNSDSRQASICGGMGAGSRRQSSVPRGTGWDVDSTSTLGASSSPVTRFKRPQLHISEAPGAEPKSAPSEPPTPTPPIDSLPPTRNESRSLDPFPDVRNRQLELPRLSGKRSSRSLENCTQADKPSPDAMLRLSNHMEVFSNGDASRNDDAGIGSSAEDVQVPLLGGELPAVIGNCHLRHGRSSGDSLPEFFPNKRWRSLEEIPGSNSVDDGGRNKKMISRGSIRSWLVGLFNGNGLRTSDASLRKGINGGFGELQSEKESIV